MAGKEGGTGEYWWEDPGPRADGLASLRLENCTTYKNTICTLYWKNHNNIWGN